MGSFINHKTNISAFSSQLRTICEQITAPLKEDHTNDTDQGVSSDNSNRAVAVEAQERQEAQDFLDEQKNRIVQLERNLLQLTHEILPNDDDSSMSMTELSRAIYELQNHYIRQLTLVRQRLDPLQEEQQQDRHAATTTTPNNDSNNNVVQKHWTVGRILTAVPEADHETDTSVMTSAKSNASSSTFFKSPKTPFPLSSSSATPQLSPSVRTMTTPSKNTTARKSRSRRISSSNAPPHAIHEEDEEDIDEHAAVKHSQDTIVEDDRATFDDHRQQLSTSSSSANTSRLSTTSPHSSFISNHNDSISFNNVDLNQTGRSSGQRRVDKFAELEERLRNEIVIAGDVTTDLLSLEEDHDTEAEQTFETLTPTLVADRQKEEVVNSNNNNSTINNVSLQVSESETIECPTLVQAKTPRSARRFAAPRRPSHIEYDSNYAASPSMNTVLTMEEGLDETMADLTTCLEEAMAGLEPVQENSLDDDDEQDEITSQISTETPVLDRYRLDQDDKVPGGLVVRPNPRRHRLVNSKLHRQQQQLQQQPSTVSSGQLEGAIRTTAPRKPLQPTGHTEAIRRVTYQPSHVSRLLDTEKRTTFRSTQSVPARDFDDWSAPEQVSTNRTSSSGNIGTKPVRRTFPSESDSRQSTSSDDTPSFPKQSSPTMQKQQSGLPSSQRNSTSNPASRLHTSLPVAYNSDDSSPEQHEEYPLSFSEASPAPQIRQISEAEYEASPRVVTMQVPFPQAQEAVRKLNQAWRNRVLPAANLSNTQLRYLWPEISERQCSTLLLSLCHWRRLSSRKLEDKTVVYQIVRPKTSL